ncbi:hypothetical protein D3C72_896700 [compost metagenome]
MTCYYWKAAIDWTKWGVYLLATTLLNLLMLQLRLNCKKHYIKIARSYLPQSLILLSVNGKVQLEIMRLFIQQDIDPIFYLQYPIHWVIKYIAFQLLLDFGMIVLFLVEIGLIVSILLIFQ